MPSFARGFCLCTEKEMFLIINISVNLIYVYFLVGRGCLVSRVRFLCSSTKTHRDLRLLRIKNKQFQMAYNFKSTIHALDTVVAVVVAICSE